jgi:hypothetical protein
LDQTVKSSPDNAATKEELLLEISNLKEENKTLCAIAETANQNLGHLKSAIESYSGGFALYDAQDKLVLCNETYRKTQPELADVFNPGSSLENIVRTRINRRLFDPAIERKTKNGKYVEIREFKTTEGEIAVFPSDITPPKIGRRRHARKRGAFSCALQRI